ncbi:MAG: hypothetical protein QOE54_6158 [Streptosporangiaceae bacterium]|jgi:hypothetical protein|nr:domain containing protein [Streptosporangiaceae bacterium]MDX6433792.1 hypothetical protein [Streptosporangiaceae bacterium]
MAMNCPTCRTPFQPGDLICLTCGANLARVGRRNPPTREDERRRQQAQQQQPAQPPPPVRPAEPHAHPPQEPYAQPAPDPYAQPAPDPYAAPDPYGVPDPYGAQRPQQGPYEPNPGPRGPQGPYEPQVQRPQDSAHPHPPPPVRPPVTPQTPPRREETLIPPEARQQPQRPAVPDSTAFMCPHCESVLTDPSAAQCNVCLRPLRATPTVLRLLFPAAELKVSVGQHLVLGRDVGQSPVAGTFTQYDNVSRRHTTVWLDPSGTAWVRDERSTNGTFVNGQRLPAGVEAPLNDGDQLRLAADVTGTVHLG